MVRAGRTIGVLLAVVTLSSACGVQGSDGATQASEPTARARALPCIAGDQSHVALDVPGPGRTTPEQAVAPYAGALEVIELVTDEVDETMVVVGLGPDDIAFRVYRVTKRSDGWWPDSYAECRT
jgi:hypothetical protein